MNKLGVQAFLGILAVVFLSSSAHADLAVAYSGSSDQAVIVSFFDRHTEGNNLVGTLQIQNISGTWVYLEQDLTSSPNPVNMPYTIYLLGPDDIKTFPNFTFPRGDYLKLTVTTPVGLDFTQPSEKLTSLEGALAVDLSARGLLTFSLPADAFDEPPVGEVVDPLLDTFVSTVSPIGELGTAIKDKSVSETFGAITDMAADSQDVKNTLTTLLKNDVTADQVQNALGDFAEFINLPEKVALVTDLSARTFEAPPVTWSRLDVVTRTQTPNISSVSPTVLTTMPVPQTQTLTIHGSGFTSSSSLVFTIGSATYPSRPDRLQFIDANTLEYNIAVGSAVGTWSVSLADGTGSATFQVNAASSGLYTITPLNGSHGSITPDTALTKAGGESQTFVAVPQDSTYTVDSWYVDGNAVPTTGNRFTLAGIQSAHTVYVTFKPATTTAETGALTVTLQPTGAISAGAQWQVNGTYYNSSDVANPLTPGQYTVSFKPVSGFTAPASFSVTIAANAETTTNATYTLVAPTTYTLTLNAANGSVSPSPLGTLSGGSYVYNAGQVVQLYAGAVSGYHFTGWSGDLTGSINPTNITMSGNKTITPNFASGDPNLTTVTVTIKPDAAANAGVTWSVTGDSQLRASGISLSEAVGSGYTTYLSVTLNLVAGWLGTNGATSFLVPITAGITTNVMLTCISNTTPGLLTVTLSPPDAVNAGAHWHVNGNAYGNGASVSLPPGNYTVTFDSVSDWTAPASQSVVVQPSGTKVISGNYTPPAGQPVIISISPPIGPNNGGTVMTINGANFTGTTNVLIGGKSATNVAVVSATLITCLTPSSTTNGSVLVVVQTTGGSVTNSNGFAYGISRGNKLDFVSAIGGSCFGVAVNGNYAYVGEGRNFLVLDISQSSPSKVGYVTLPGLIKGIALLPPNNQYAYVADEEGGLQVVDVSNSTAPKIAGFYSTTNQLWSAAVTIFGGRAYVADETSGLQIFDLSNPASPALLSSTNIGGGEAIVVKGSVNGVFAYVSTGSSLNTVDVSNPLSPIPRGQTSINGGYAYSLAISGNYVYAASLFGNLEILDVSNTNAPADIGHAPSIYFASAVTFANGYIYAASILGVHTLYAFSPSGSSLTLLGQTTATTASYGYNILVSGSKAYVAGGSSGFEVIDVSNPYSPTLSSSFNDSGIFGQYDSVAITGNSLAAFGSGIHTIFNVSNPSQLSFAANLNVANGSYVLANNGLAYILSGNSNFIFNISTPSSPSLVKLFPDGGHPISMSSVESMLYEVGYSDGSQPYLAAIDVSTPSFPAVRGTKTFTEFSSTGASAFAVNGTKALIGISGPNEVISLDISNIASPVEQGAITNLPYYPKAIQISQDGNYGYVLMSGSPSSMYVLNVNQPASPTVVTNIPLDTGGGTDLQIQGNEIFVATFRGLYVFDISNPASPVLTRSYSILSEIEGIGLPDSVAQSGNIYLATLDGGIVVLREQDDEAPDVYVTDPIFGSTWTTTSSTTELGGGSDDNVSVTAITWSNNRGGSGQVSAPFDSWYVSNISLYPGTNLLTVTAYDAAGNTGTDTLAVVYQTDKQDQTITFPSIANHTFGDAPISLAAAASSGLPVAFNVISGAAEVTSSNTLILTGAGAVTVEATQLGNDLFNPATPVDVSFNVTQASQVITFAPLPDKSAGDEPFILSATTSSRLPVYFSILSGPATLDTSNNLTLLGGGTVTVLAYQPGDSNYNAAATVQQSFNVSKIPQAITFGILSAEKIGDAPFPLNATASSGLQVSYSLSGPATLSGNIVTLIGYGTVTVTALQSGNNMYAAAANVVQSFVVAAPDNTLIGLGFQDGAFQMAFYGMVGSNYVFDASSNLLNWQPFTNFILTDSPQYFNDSATTNFNQRFYRAMKQ